MVEAGFALECADAELLHDGFALADLAHAVALLEAGVTPARDGRRLLRGLLAMQRLSPGEIGYDPALGDPWNSRERVAAARIGGPAGWLTVGRPRREAGRVAFRLALRRHLLAAHAALGDLAAALLEQAGRHRRTLMADHTYLQPAQPTTLGYVLLGMALPVLRDGDRLRRAFAWADASPAGAGGVGGSPLPVDRGRLAALLGFAAVAVHARDAMWQTDGLIETLAVAAGAAAHAGQLAADLEIWASPPFGFVAFDDGYSRASALMPQKKNPYPVAVVRGTAGVLAGRLAGYLAVLHTPSARTDHLLFGYGEIPRALDLLARSELLLAGVVRTMTADVDRLARSAEGGFTEAADVADALTRAGLLDHRRAHQVVGAAVRAALARGETALTAAGLTGAARSLGIRLTVPDGLVEQVADPRAAVAARTVEGGTAPRRMAEMLRSARRNLERDAGWRAATTARLDRAEADLLERARDLARP